MKEQPLGNIIHMGFRYFVMRLIRFKSGLDFLWFAVIVIKLTLNLTDWILQM